jgi:hypothetical protein
MNDVETRSLGGRAVSLPVRGAVAVVLAVAANVAVVFAADALSVAPDFQAISVPPVAFLSAVGAAGATVVYWLLARSTDDRDAAFVRVAAVVLVLSFVPDVALLAVDDAATVAGVLVLMAMHVVVAAVSVGVLLAGGDGR